MNVLHMNGRKYAASDYALCRFCGKILSHPWVINDGATGQNYYLCEDHYLKWERRRDDALIAVRFEFSEAIAAQKRATEK